MTNSEKISYWKGGKPSELLKFSNPYDYEGCVIGVSTDGRVVYDLNDCLNFVYQNEKDDHDDSEDEIKMQAADMMSHDLGLYERQGIKAPVLRNWTEGDDESEFKEAFNDDTFEYDFSDAVIGHSFRDDRFILSLSDMMYELEENGFDTKSALRYIYALKPKSKYDDTFPVIVDDYFTPVFFDVLSDSDEANKEVTLERIKSNAFLDEIKEIPAELKDSYVEVDTVCFKKMLQNEVSYLEDKEPHAKHYIFNVLHFKKINDKQLMYEFTNGKYAVQGNLQADVKAADFDMSLGKAAAYYLSCILKTTDKVKLYSTLDDKVYLTVNDEVYASKKLIDNYVDIGKIINFEAPYSVKCKTEDLKAFLEKNAGKDKEDKSMVLNFSDGKITLSHGKECTAINAEHTCPENLQIKFNMDFFKTLLETEEQEITFSVDEKTSRFMTKQNGRQAILMTIQ